MANLFDRGNVNEDPWSPNGDSFGGVDAVPTPFSAELWIDF